MLHRHCRAPSAAGLTQATHQHFHFRLAAIVHLLAATGDGSSTPRGTSEFATAGCSLAPAVPPSTLFASLSPSSSCAVYDASSSPLLAATMLPLRFDACAPFAAIRRRWLAAPRTTGAVFPAPPPPQRRPSPCRDLTVHILDPSFNPLVFCAPALISSPFAPISPITSAPPVPSALLRALSRSLFVRCTSHVLSLPFDLEVKTLIIGAFRPESSQRHGPQITDDDRFLCQLLEYDEGPLTFYFCDEPLGFVFSPGIKLGTCQVFLRFS
ncbi:hypothetical protein C8R45DRAFT_1110852 [Mycena sanguinolenta]|nr:hypothetical protein C8R45DRAFT_1110852 [Mycena sanguinolenta]